MKNQKPISHTSPSLFLFVTLYNRYNWGSEHCCATGWSEGTGAQEGQ